MATETLHAWSKRRSPLSGLLLISALTALAIWASSIPWLAGLGLGALTLAILFGILVGNTLYPWLQPSCHSGVQLVKQYLLRLGIILYGFRLTFQQIADIGATGISIDALMLTTTFLLACWLGKKFGIDSQTTMLIGAGSSICGAAAVLATEPLLKAEASKVAVAVSTVVVFGTLAIFAYPWLYQLNAHMQWLSFTQETFGIYIGSTLHEVAQVVATGHAIGPDAENAAVITKMIRVMMLAPFLLLLSGYIRRGSNANQADRSAITIPWFAVLFIAVAGLNSCQLISVALVQHLITIDTWVLAMAMSALGLTTHISAVHQAGIKPILLATLLFIWLLVGGAAINQLLQHPH